MENNKSNKFTIFLFGLGLGVFMTMYFGDIKVIKETKHLQTQIDSLKKQDSIKELYRVYNIPTGADTLLKPISK